MNIISNVHICAFLSLSGPEGLPCSNFASREASSWNGCTTSFPASNGANCSVITSASGRSELWFFDLSCVSGFGSTGSGVVAWAQVGLESIASEEVSMLAWRWRKMDRLWRWVLAQRDWEHAKNGSPWSTFGFQGKRQTARTWAHRWHCVGAFLLGIPPGRHT